MAQDRYLEKKSRTNLIKFGLVGGIEADTDPARVRVLDSNNVFPSPNGTEAGPRPGCEIRKRYRVTTSPTGRKAIVIETAPPDVGLGNLIMVINTRNGRNAIEAGAFVRDRTQLPQQSASSVISLENGSLSVESINPTNVIDIFAVRDGDISVEATIHFTTRDGTATSGGGYYVATSGNFTFDPGVSTTMMTGVEVPFVADAIGKFFFFDISAVSSNAIIGSTATAVINIVSP